MRARLQRIVTIGDTAVGKTSIITRLVYSRFNENEKSTVGAMFVLHQEKVGDETVEMQIWDTAGQERFKSLGPIYYRGSAAAVIVFDLTSQQTFNKVSEWLSDFSDVAGRDCAIMVLGNKSDMADEREVSREDAEQLARKIDAIYFETSALTGSGIREAFAALAVELKKRGRKEMNTEAKDLETKEGQPETKKCC